MINHNVYVIYKDGQPLKPNRNAGTTKAAYVTKGTAKATVTSLAKDQVNYSLGLYRYDNAEKFDKELEKEKDRYEIVEYVPNKGVTI